MVDPATGYVYVSDTFNQAIRMIVPSTGVVTTLVGVTPASVGVGGTGILPLTYPAGLPATLAFPFGIALDPHTGQILLGVHDAILTSPY